MKTIILVGFPGSGKSTVGKRLASRLSLPFYDTDVYFTQKYHISISDFFSTYGEKFFRICENSVLKELLALPPCVISTGGGLPCYFEAMELMNETAFTIYLKLSPKSLFNRLYYSKKERPLVKNMTQEVLSRYVEQTLQQRDIFYSKAKLCIKGEDMKLDDLVEKLHSLLL